MVVACSLALFPLYYYDYYSYKHECFRVHIIDSLYLCQTVWPGQRSYLNLILSHKVQSLCQSLSQLSRQRNVKNSDSLSQWRHHTKPCHRFKDLACTFYSQSPKEQFWVCNPRWWPCEPDSVRPAGRCTSLHIANQTTAQTEWSTYWGHYLHTHISHVRVKTSTCVYYIKHAIGPTNLTGLHIVLSLSLSLSLSLFHHIVHSVIFFLFFFSQYYIYKPQTQNICHILSIACEQKHNLFVYADVSCLFMFMQACLFMFVYAGVSIMFVYVGVSIYVCVCRRVYLCLLCRRINLCLFMRRVYLSLFMQACLSMFVVTLPHTRHTKQTITAT